MCGSGVRMFYVGMVPNICLYVLNGKVLLPDPVSTFRRNGPLTHGFSYFTLNVVYASLGLIGLRLNLIFE